MGPSVLVAVVALVLVGLAGASWLASTNTSSSSPLPASPATLRSSFKPAASACVGCHAGAVERWRGSQHARAQRPFEAAHDAAPPGAPATPLAVIGVAPLQQFVVDDGAGRWQVFDPALDVDDGGWFSIHGADAPAAGEARHWAGRGMTWNTQCATCHVTGLRKGYDVAGDRFATTFAASGVACAACHGDDTGHASPGASSTLVRGSVDACLACHARREALTASYAVGEDFDDHFRLLVADEPGLLFADGRARDEAFEASSFLGSRMAHAGVTCLDCHEPHGGGLRRSIGDDALCLGCHGAPGARGAVLVDPPTHTHHPSLSAGARCVACHMPTRTFMDRDARRDHGFTSPDPQLAVELGLPDTCRACHVDRDATWSTTMSTRWYGEGEARRSARRRARVVAAARAGDRGVTAELAALLRSEDNVAWRAALTSLARAFVDDEAVAAAVVDALAADEPLVRVAAVRALASSSVAHRLLLPLRGDPVRSVRIAAAWATRTTPWTGALAEEMAVWLEENADQPAGRVRLGEWALVQGRAADAIGHGRRAVAWDPSPPTLFFLARALAVAGQAEEARAVHAAARAALASRRQDEP